LTGSASDKTGGAGGNESSDGGLGSHEEGGKREKGNAKEAKVSKRSTDWRPNESDAKLGGGGGGRTGKGRKRRQPGILITGIPLQKPGKPGGSGGTRKNLVCGTQGQDEGEGRGCAGVGLATEQKRNTAD